jgi:hypothetical protein
MGLETYHGKTYYYRKIRIGDRVKSQYGGAGDDARMFAALEEEKREEVAAERARWKARQAASDAEEQQIVDYARVVERAVVEALRAAGYHRQGRRFRWARVMGKAIQDKTDKPGKGWTWDIRIPSNNLEPEAEACRELACKAQDGDPAALLEYLAKSSDSTRVSLGNGNLGGVAKLELAHKYAKGNPVIKHAVLAKMRLLRDELAGESPNQPEWHLADVAAQCWADFQRCQIERDCLKDGTSLSVRNYYDKRLDRAHKRFIRSLKALAAVRRVPNLTAVQVNLGNALVDRFLKGRPEPSIEVEGQEK